MQTGPRLVVNPQGYSFGFCRSHAESCLGKTNFKPAVGTQYFSIQLIKEGARKLSEVGAYCFKFAVIFV